MFIFGSAPLIGEDKTVLLWAVVLVVVSLNKDINGRLLWALLCSVFLLASFFQISG